MSEGVRTPVMIRWWLHRRWARDARADIVARVDLLLLAFGVAVALLLR
ncbi:MAG TPA: hypothetical protein VNG69_15985 [Casimicrobiaceae bacterium]|nr:hypothetical protein [Casimicrobiaceae bacterium]